MIARVVDLRKGKAQPVRSGVFSFAQKPEPPRRVSPLRQKRRRARLATLGMVLIALAAAAYAVHFVSYLDSLIVSEVRVTGMQKIEPSIVQSYVESELSNDSWRYFSRSNIFLYSREEIEAGIVAAFPRVKTAQISRTALFSQELIVDIQEREQYALWCRSDTECYAMDDAGYIFTAMATTTGEDLKTIYRFSGGLDAEPIGANLVPQYFAGTLQLLATVQKETGLIPYRIDILRDQDFHVYVSQGFFIKASLGQDAGALARNLELVLDSEALRDRIAEIEYVDMRFGNRVYYKMKGEEQSNI